MRGWRQAFSILGAVVLAALTACSQPSGPPAKGGASSGGGKKVTIALLPKQKGLKYFTSCAQGAEEAAKELGNVELIYDGPTPATASIELPRVPIRCPGSSDLAETLDAPVILDSISRMRIRPA
jgi:hypothetical protein